MFSVLSNTILPYKMASSILMCYGSLRCYTGKILKYLAPYLVYSFFFCYFFSVYGCTYVSILALQGFLLKNTMKKRMIIIESKLYMY